MDGKQFWWSEANVKLLKERYATDGPKKLAGIMGTTAVSVTMKARRLGLTEKRETKPYVWTERMDRMLKGMYSWADKETLLKSFSLPLHAIRTRARKLGLFNGRAQEFSGRTRMMNSTSCNIHFFDEWSPDMAYVLGFLFADGSINKRETDMIVAVAIKDIAVLDFIRDVTKCRRKYHHVQAHSKDGYNHSEAVFLTLASTVLTTRLMELGLHRRKTYRDDPLPDVPEDLLPHFVRGFFDGDGTACVDHTGRCRIGFVGTHRFITGIVDVLVKHAGMKRNGVNRDTSSKRPTFRCNWTRTDDLRKFRDYVYPAGYSFCLERKKAVLDNWLNNKSL